MIKDAAISCSMSKIKFHISKIRSLSKENSTDPLVLNTIFDELNALDGDYVSSEDKFTCIQLCCSSITPSDAMLIGKCGQMILKFIKNEEITEHLALFIIQWCIQALLQSPDISQIELLCVLEHMLKTRIDSRKELVDDILKVLKNPLENKSKLILPGEILLQRLNCIRALIPAMNTYHIQIVKDVLFDVIQNKVNCKVKNEVLLIELEILQMICEKNNSWLSDNIGVVLGVALALSSYGLPHHVQCIPQYILPTPMLPDCQPESKKVNKTKNRRKPKKSAAEKIKSAPVDEPWTVELNSSLSESDFSDSENNRTRKIRKNEQKIRLSALSLLLYVVKNVSRKEMIGYWDNILNGPYSLLKSFSNDTSPRSRVAITSILSLLFSSSKMYISQAQHSCRNNAMPYVSWSHLLADLVVTAHTTLCDVVLQSQSTASILSILNCLIVFIRNTPYHRLNEGILRKIIFSVTPLLKHVDFSVRSSAIKCISEIVILEPNTEEQILLIRCNPKYIVSSPRNDSWIILYCLESFKNDKLSVTVRAECWLLLGHLAKHHFITNISGENLDEILSLLQKDLQDGNVMIQRNAAKAFEQIAVPMGSLESSCGVDCYAVWLAIVQGPLVPMLQSTSGILAAAAADCIANITCSVFEKLPERLRIFVMTALFGCVSHEEHLARAAAARTLGTIVVFPFLSQDIQIIYDVADRIVCAMADDNLMVRMKAAWALGNLSDVLLSGKETGVPIEEVPLLNILEMAVRTGSDHEKVKACSMRAVGNLLLLIEENHLQTTRYRQLVEEAAVVLNSNSLTENNMKVRWNACYSFGNMFKNELLLIQVNTGWQFSAFDTLSKLIVNCTNFKVRQAATNALCMISRREYYGEYYHKLWPTLMKAFENSQNLPDFAEYKHQRNLIDQLCLLLCHLCGFLTTADLHSLHPILPENIDLCIKYTAELKKRNVNNSANFQSSINVLENLLRLNLSSIQQEVANKLKKVMEAQESICELE